MMATYTIYGKQHVPNFEAPGGGAHGVFGTRLVTRFQLHFPPLIL